jgi:hypothetical protein
MHLQPGKKVIVFLTTTALKSWFGSDAFSFVGPMMCRQSTLMTSFAWKRSEPLSVLSAPPFDDATWNAYTTAMEQVIAKPGVVRRIKPHEVDKCGYFLFSRQSLAPVTIFKHGQQLSTENLDENQDDSHMLSKSANSLNLLHSALQEQSRLFQQRYNFTKQEHEFITRCLVYVGDFCAKPQPQLQNNGLDRRAPILVSWHKIKEMGWIPRENCFSTYMYILTSAADDNNDLAPTNDHPSHKPSSISYNNAQLEIFACHGQLYGSNEKTVAIQLKNLIRLGDVSGAEQLLTSLENEAKLQQQPIDLGLRLRTFLPLMEQYCEMGDGKAILRLYHRMREAPGTYLDDEAYTLILASLARHGFFQSQLGEPYGWELFETLASTMADDVLELTPVTATLLEESFRVGHYNIGKNASEKVVVRHVTIPSNCTCPTTGAKLRLLRLSDNQRQHVHDNLLEMARLSCQEFIQKWNLRNKRQVQAETASMIIDEKIEDRAYQAILNFSEWLE